VRNQNDQVEQVQVQKCDFRCLSCAHSFDNKLDLVKHMKRRGHFKSIEELKEDEAEFKSRIQGRSSDDWTQAERNTYATLCVHQGLLIKMSPKRT
jgi:hypothetical protein